LCYIQIAIGKIERLQQKTEKERKRDSSDNMKVFIFSLLVYGLYAMMLTNVPDPESPKYSFNWGVLGFTTVIGGFLITTFRVHFFLLNSLKKRP